VAKHAAVLRPVPVFGAVLLLMFAHNSSADWKWASEPGVKAEGNVGAAVTLRLLEGADEGECAVRGESNRCTDAIEGRQVTD